MPPIKPISQTVKPNSIRVPAIRAMIATNLPRDGRIAVMKMKANHWIAIGISSVLACVGMAQENDDSPHRPAFETSDGTNQYDYSAVSPSVALDLTSPLRFKPIMGVEIGFISMRRSTPQSFSFVQDQNGAELLNMDQLQGGSGYGLDTKLHFYNLFSDSKAIDVEMRYFQVSDMTFDQTLTATQVIPLFFNAVPASPVSTNQVYYNSLIRSFESNLVARTPWRIRMLAGFRYFEVDDDFNINNNIAQPPTQVRSRTRNSMGGGQIGTEVVLISNAHAKMWCSAKWATLNNEVTGNAVAVNPSTGSPLVSILSGSTTTQLLDLEWAGSVSITRNWSIYGGYQGLIAQGVGLATSQSRDSSLFSPTNPITLDDPQWHGYKLGVVATF